MNEFEHELRKHPLKSPPVELRKRILEAGLASDREVAGLAGENWWSLAFKRMLHTKLNAWTCLAGVWVLILLFSLDAFRLAQENEIQHAQSKPERPVDLDVHYTLIRDWLDADPIMEVRPIQPIRDDHRPSGSSFLFLSKPYLEV